jgi:hypothetical protein
VEQADVAGEVAVVATVHDREVGPDPASQFASACPHMRAAVATSIGSGRALDAQHVGDAE